MSQDRVNANRDSPQGVPADRMAEASNVPPETAMQVEAMGHRTARGFAWMLSQTLATKAIGTVGQFLILALLAPEDIGAVGIAYALSIVPVLVQQGGLRQVLVQRSLHFHRWANPTFWLSLTLGSIAALLMVALIPVAMLLSSEPRVPGLMLLVAVLFPLDSLNVVPMARMQSQLRFRLVAALAFVQNSGQVALSLVLALMHFGPYSLVLSRVIVLICVGVMAWSTSPVRIRRSPQIRRFRFLMADGWLVIAVNGSNLVSTYLPNLVLGRDAKAVGFYSTAYSLSVQTMVLFTENLGSVLLPVLSKLKNEPRRQTEGFIRAAKLMASLGIFGCLLQVPIAGPLLHGLFGDKWSRSIAVIQILSIGMAMKIIGAPANSLLYAQGRFRTEAMFSVVSTGAFLLFILVGAWLDQVRGVAMAAALHMLLTEPVHLYLAVHSTGYGWTVVLRTFALPLALSVLAIGSATMLSMLIPAWPGRDWWVIGVVLLVSGGLYLPMFRLFMPSEWVDGLSRAKALLGR